jgi:hypothetical protein
MPAVLNQLAPFNAHRFEAVIAYMSWKAKVKRTFDQYEMLKLHVMIDVLHVLKYGQPVIGGQLEAWQDGPVVHEAYYQVTQWIRSAETGGVRPRYLCVTRGHGRRNVILCTATAEPDPDDFSESELEVMRQAWKLVVKQSYADLKKYFHEDASFIGRAYKKAVARDPGQTYDIQISWDDIIDEYAKEHRIDPEYVAYLKGAIRL